MQTQTIKPLAYPVAPLIEAINAFDATALQRSCAWDEATSVSDVAAAVSTDAQALRAVQAAFYEVTKDRNSLQSCESADMAFMRRIASMER